jgi:hypothetical protein
MSASPSAGEPADVVQGIDELERAAHRLVVIDDQDCRHADPCRELFEKAGVPVSGTDFK